MAKLKRAEVEIRAASPMDVQKIAVLCEQLGYQSTLDDVRPRLMNVLKDDSHIIYVAHPPEGAVIGWIHAHVYPLIQNNLFAEIGGIVIDEDYRKSGIGRLLMDTVEKWARMKGCLGVNLRANVLRRDAHVFYENIGYRRLKQQITFCKRF